MVGSLPAHVEEVEVLAAPSTHFKFGNGTFIFVAVNPNLAILLRGGKTGHLSIDFRGDWMQQGFRMDAIPLHIQRGDVSKEETYLADCPAGSSESVHVEHACPEQPAPDDVHVSSCVPPDDPTALSSKNMVPWHPWLPCTSMANPPPAPCHFTLETAGTASVLRRLVPRRKRRSRQSNATWANGRSPGSSASLCATGRCTARGQAHCAASSLEQASPESPADSGDQAGGSGDRDSSGWTNPSGHGVPGP